MRALPLLLAGALALHAAPAAGFGAPAMIEDIRPGSASSAPMKLLSLGDRLFFVADDGVTGFEPMVSRGTAATTGLLRDLWPGPNSGGFQGCPTCNAIAIGSSAYFSASDGGPGGSQLWRSDGTVAGTQKVYADAAAVDLVNVSGTVHFAGIPTGGGAAVLFTSDGTGAGTANVNAPIGLYGDHAAAFNGRSYFPASGGFTGVELWSSDGTALGTIPLSDLAPGSANASPTLITPVGSAVFFAAFTDSGPSLCRTDGTFAGTQALARVRVGVLETRIGQIVDLNGLALFIGEDATGGYELWRSDGTRAGTERVVDLFPGTRGGLEGSSLVVMGNAVYFAADDGLRGRELWRSDGTAIGTMLVKDIDPTFGAFGHSSPAGLANVNGTLFFRAKRDGSPGAQPWTSDGTAAGTAQLAEVNPNGSSQASQFIEVDGTIYFTATDGVHGVELWGMDAATVGVPPHGLGSRGVALSHAWPNPARTETRFSYTLSRAQRVRLDLLDLQGRVVRGLVAGEVSAGLHEVALDTGRLASGVYLVRLEGAEGAATRRILVVR